MIYRQNPRYRSGGEKASKRITSGQVFNVNERISFLFETVKFVFKLYRVWLEELEEIMQADVKPLGSVFLRGFSIPSFPYYSVSYRRLTIFRTSSVFARHRLTAPHLDTPELGLLNTPPLIVTQRRTCSRMERDLAHRLRFDADSVIHTGLTITDRGFQETSIFWR
jgi:hypothetical protein